MEDEPLLSKEKYSQLRQAAVSDGSLVIKAYCGSQIRRIPILNRELNFAELCLMMQRLFKHALSTNLDNIELQYRDDEGDWIEITDDLDILHAVSLSPVLCIRVFDRETLPNPDKLTYKHTLADPQSLRTELNFIIERLLTIQSMLNEVEHPQDKGDIVPIPAEPSPKVKPLTTADMAEFLETQSTASSRNSSIKAVELHMVQSPKMEPVRTALRPKENIPSVVPAQSAYNQFYPHPINYVAPYSIHVPISNAETHQFHPQTPNAPPHSAGFSQAIGDSSAPEAHSSTAPILSLPPSLSQTLSLPNQMDKLKNLRLS